MGGLLHLVQRGETGRGPSLPRPLLAVPNVTAHPSTTNVTTSYYSMWHYNCMPLDCKGLMVKTASSYVHCLDVGPYYRLVTDRRTDKRIEDAARSYSLFTAAMLSRIKIAVFVYRCRKIGTVSILPWMNPQEQPGDSISKLESQCYVNSLIYFANGQVHHLNWQPY